MTSEPASAKASMKGSAGAIIRCTSSGFVVCGRIAFTTAGPIVMLGTKWPSITSTCTQSQPAASMARTSSPSRAKSAERMEGAIRMSPVTACSISVSPCLKKAWEREHRHSPDAARPGFAAPGLPLQKLHHGAGHVGAARLLHALDAGRGVHLDPHRPAAGPQHIDARDIEAEHLGRADGGAALAVRDDDGLGLAAAVQVGAELAGGTEALHAGHHLPTNHQRANVGTAGLLDVLLHQDVEVEIGRAHV